jgi:hypothetical protein
MDRKLTYTPDPTAQTKLAALARKEGLTLQEFFTRLADAAVRDVLGESDDLDPKKVAQLMDVSKFTVIRWFNQGLFRKAYMINSRVIRIPRADVERLKRDRQLVIE